MKMRIAFLLTLLSMALLAGCGTVTSKLTADDIKQLSQTRQAEQANCLSWMAQMLTQELAMINKMTPDQAYFSLLQRSQNQLTRDLVSMFTGKSAGLCSGGANIYDLLIVELHETNETFREGIRTVGSVGKFWLGAEAATDIFGSIMSRVGNQYQINGDGNLLADVGNSTQAGRDGILQTGGMNQADRVDTRVTQVQEGGTTGPNAAESPFSGAATDNRPIEYAPATAEEGLP